MVLVSLVLPAHNEEKELASCVEAVKRALTGFDYEIIIAEDGSADDTVLVAKALAKKHKSVKLITSSKRLGRGKALVNAFKKARGEFVGYCDVDLATHPRHLKELFFFLEDYDVAVGSRYLPASRVSRDFKRAFLSFWYNFLVRFLLGSRLKDHQCGFKAFRKSVVMDLAKRVESNHWFWDTELLVFAEKLGYEIKEFPVEWREHAGSTKVDLRKDVFEMFSSIVGLWLRIFLKGV